MRGLMKKLKNRDRPGAVVYSRDEHNVSRKNIDPDALKILRRLIRHGYIAYLVGGGVRDLLLGKRPKDFDIATDATPKKIKALFRNCRIIGRRFKLAHIYFHAGKIIEVSTFRDFNVIDDHEANGDPDDLLITRDNTYGTERTDALRRDLSINALFYDLSSFSVIDYVGGMQDLKDGVAKMIGDPEVRFGEDPVRMMRLARHAARAGFKVDPTHAQAIVANHELLTKSSAVRLYEELKKDLTSGSCRDILCLLSEFNLLEHLVPELAGCESALLVPNSYLSRALENVDQIMLNNGPKTPTSVLALLALFSNTGSIVQPDLKVRFDNVEILLEFLRQCFSLLSVPKRERDKIQRLLTLWLELERTSLDRLKISRFRNSACLSDLVYLFRYLNTHGSKDEIIKFLKGIKKKGHSEKRSRHPVRKKDRRQKSNRRKRRF